MPPARFEPTIPASERPQTHTLERAATGIGLLYSVPKNIRLDPVRYTQHLRAVCYEKSLSVQEVYGEQMKSEITPNFGVRSAIPPILGEEKNVAS